MKFKKYETKKEFLDENLEICEINNEKHDFKYRYSRFCKNKNDMV